MGRGVSHIDKHEFLPLYRLARQAALHQNNIQAGFAATGLVPYSHDRMLAQLHIENQTPLPQRRPQSNASRTPETHHNAAELQKQTALLNRYLKRRTHSPPSPAGQALGQIVKACEVAISNAVLLVEEGKKLHAENQCQKQKRAKRRTCIVGGGSIRSRSGLSSTSCPKEGSRRQQR
jgi:hypothetical protein